MHIVDTANSFSYILPQFLYVCVLVSRLTFIDLEEGSLTFGLIIIISYMFMLIALFPFRCRFSTAFCRFSVSFFLPLSGCYYYCIIFIWRSRTNFRLCDIISFFAFNFPCIRNINIKLSSFDFLVVPGGNFMLFCSSSVRLDIILWLMRPESQWIAFYL
jgi:hypothetical protein